MTDHLLTDIVLMTSILIATLSASKLISIVFSSNHTLSIESIGKLFKAWLLILTACFIYQVGIIIDVLLDKEIFLIDTLSLMLLYVALIQIQHNTSSQHMALDNTRDLIKRLNYKTSQLETINNTIQAFFTEDDKKSLLLKLLNSAKEITGSKYAGAGIKAADGKISDFIPLGMPKFEKSLLPMGEDIFKKLLHSHNIMVIDDLSKSPYFKGFPKGHMPMKTFLGVPIVGNDNQSEGLIFLSEKQNGKVYSEDDVQAVETLAKAASVAIEKIKLIDETTLAKKEWEKTFDAMSELVLIVNSDLKITRANMAVIMGTEIEYSKLINQDCSVIFSNEMGDSNIIENIKTVFNEKMPASFETYLTNLECDFWITATPFHMDDNGNITEALIVMTDIRSLKKLTIVEEEKKALEEATAYKTRLIATVSHEIRNPLTSIIGYIDLIQGGHNKIDDVMKNDWLKIIHGEAHRISNFIEEVLNFTKIEAGKVDINFRVYDIANMIETVCEPFTTRSKEHTVDYEINLNNVEALGDEEKLSRVLGNLIENSIKYSPHGGAINIRAEIDKDENFFLVSVEDNGIGIPEEYIDHIFEPFHRVETPDRMGIKGTGLGLSICENIIHLHNCRIWAQSSTGKDKHGTTFFFTVPVNNKENSENIKS